MTFLSKILAHVLLKFLIPADQTLNFNRFEKFAYKLVLKFNLNFNFLRGYLTLSLFYFKLSGQHAEYTNITNQLLNKLDLADMENTQEEKLVSILLGVGGLDFYWYLRFFHGVLYSCSQVGKFNCICVLDGTALNQIYVNEGKQALYLEYARVLQMSRSKIGILVSVYNFNEGKNIISHNELLLMEKISNSTELEFCSVIGEKGVQNIVKIFEEYRDLFDNNVEEFMQALLKYSEETKTSSELRIGLRGNCTCISICAILQNGEVIVFPLFV